MTAHYRPRSVGAELRRKFKAPRVGDHLECERCGAPAYRFDDGVYCGPCSAVVSNEACDPA